jgi:hypothetical protein
MPSRPKKAMPGSPLRARPAIKTLTPKEESFAVHRAGGSSVIDAFLASYTWTGSRTGARQNSSLVEARPRVQERIAELRAEYAKAAVTTARGEVKAQVRTYTPDDAMEELDQARTLAIAKENPNALARIVEVRMKLYGLGVADAKNPADREEMKPEELEAALADLRALMEARSGHLKH